MRVKPLSDSSFVARILAALAGAIVRRRRAFLYPQLVLLVLCVVYTAKYLQFDTSRNDLIEHLEPFLDLWILDSVIVIAVYFFAFN